MLKHILSFIWIVFTVEGQTQFQNKLNSLPEYVVWEKSTIIMQSGDWPKYTIIYWQKN